MRAFVLILASVLGVLTLSITAESQLTPAESRPVSILNHIKVGERILILRMPLGDEVPIQVVTKEEDGKWMPSDEERRLYNEVTKVLEEARTNRDINAENLSDEMKQLRENYGSLSQYAADMKERMSRKPYTVTRVGDDFIAYRPGNGNGNGDHEVFLPLHEIKSITRPVQ